MISRRGERGAATVAALGLVGLLLLVAGAAAGAVGMVVGQRRVQAAADLAALAAASALQQARAPCEAGAEIASRHRVRLTGCRVEGEEVDVSVELELPSVFAGRTIRGRARAGPDPPRGQPGT
ncbi:Rv3654c family TadE-like protein [Marmoricola sp. RAF53]|uniref:Rv3654c family TadE-like protein n=1 Tax=Marmoricola sp. RAF53 TaxID=3233059 RepID=UPI003F9AD8F7